MIENDENRTKWLHIRLRPDEYNKIKSLHEKSTCRKLSDYARRVILKGPITVKQRNQSLDDFMAEMMNLRSELKSIGTNYNQAVHKLHMLNKIDDFRIWILTNEATKQAFMEKTEKIKERINQFADQWFL